MKKIIAVGDMHQMWLVLLWRRVSPVESYCRKFEQAVQKQNEILDGDMVLLKGQRSTSGNTL